MPKSRVSVKQSPISLQYKLVKSSVLSSIVAGLIALMVLFVASVYQTMQLQDEIMDEISDLLLSSDLSANSDTQVDEISEQFEVYFQLKYDGQLLTESEDFNAHYNSVPVYLKHAHFGLAWLDGALVRTYSIEHDQQQLKLYQPLKTRFNAVFDSVLSFALILIILWLIQWLILHFSVKKQFRSIHQLSRDISEKNALDLSPIEQPQPAVKELQPIVMQLNQLLLRLEKSLLAEQRFTSDASHELRSPLSAIQMRLQLLKRKYNQSAVSADLEQMQTDVIRGANILDNLLLLARLDPTQTHVLPRSQVDLQRVIEEVIRSLEPFINEKKLSLNLELNPAVVKANQELIFSCLRNFMDNAIRYNHTAGVIDICLKPLNHSVIISIQNSGERLADEVLERMGERFYRELGSKTQGTGLGLSICKKIVELHHGNIQFNNPEQGGLLVVLELPMDFK